jgi:hypothetical protein
VRKKEETTISKMSKTFQFMYLVPRDQYAKMKDGTQSPTKTNLICDSGKAGETSQVNNIDVSHGGTLLINTGEGKDVQPLLHGGSSVKTDGLASSGWNGAEKNVAEKKLGAFGTGVRKKIGGGKKRSRRETEGGNTSLGTRGGETVIPIPIQSGSTIPPPPSLPPASIPLHPPPPSMSLPPSTPSMRSLSSSEMRQREKSMMQDIVKERLQQLNGGRGKKRGLRTVVSGADGLGEEREILHALKRSNRRSEPMEIETIKSQPQTSQPQTKPVPQRKPVVPQPRAKAAEFQPLPLTFTAVRSNQAPMGRRKRPAKSKKIKELSIYTAKPLAKKHPRSWLEDGQGRKRTRANFPFNRWPYTLPWRESTEKRAWPYADTTAPPAKTGRRGTAGMSRLKKRRLDDIDWQIAEEDADDILPPAKRKPYVSS